MQNLKCPFSHDVFWGARKIVKLDLTFPVLNVTFNGDYEFTRILVYTHFNLKL